VLAYVPRDRRLRRIVADDSTDSPGLEFATGRSG
jgi:hypothetical protein